MNPAIDYLTTTSDFEVITDEGYMKTYWNHMPFLLFDKDGEADFDGLQFKRDWDKIAKLESDNAIQAIQLNYDQIAYARQNLYIPEYDKKAGKLIHFWVIVYKIESFVARMCPKFGLAAEEMLDGIVIWQNQFSELAYDEFAPKYLKADRVIKDGRATNSTGRENGQRQESNNQGNVEYIGLAKVKHGSPAEKALKIVAKERFEQPAKAPFSGKPLKKEAFVIPEQLTSNESKITYPNGKTYKDYVKTTDFQWRNIIQEHLTVSVRSVKLWLAPRHLYINGLYVHTKDGNIPTGFNATITDPMSELNNLLAGNEASVGNRVYYNPANRRLIFDCPDGNYFPLTSLVSNSENLSFANLTRENPVHVPINDLKFELSNDFKVITSRETNFSILLVDANNNPTAFCF